MAGMSTIAAALALALTFQDDGESAPAPKQQRHEPPALPATPEEFAQRLEAEGIALDVAKQEVRLRGNLLRRERSSDYPVEYGLVVEGGFTHEAFGIVKCTPSLLNACFLALGLEPGVPRRRVKREPMPPEADLEAGIELPFEVLAPKGDRVFLYVTWTEEDGRDVVRAFEDFFVDQRNLRPLPMRGFVYLGSRFEEVKVDGGTKRIYIADYEGNVLTLHPDKSRAENCLFDVFSLDDAPYVWADVDSEKLPPSGVPLEFVFTRVAHPKGRPFEPEPPLAPIPLPPARDLARSSINPCLDGRNDEWLDRVGTRDLRDLAAILQRSRPEIRELCAELLGAAHRDEAIEPLALSLRFDRSPDVRLACAYALAEIGSAAAVEALISLLERGSPASRDDALTALRFLSGEDRGLKPLPWREWAATRGKSSR
jgi:hypothetical protein